jgi:ssDNA-binding Zn-finger/Zn-ribbon topoisomerase 1
VKHYWLLLLILPASAAELGFSKGQQPLPGRFISASACEGCHAEIVADWKTSRHKAAWSNNLMQAGYVVETQALCPQCHAPYVEQLAEIDANREHYRSRLTGVTIPALPETAAAEGISCVTCHARNGKVLATKDSQSGAHPVQVEPVMGESEFCSNCHQFPFNEVRDGVFIESDILIQSTYLEWQQSGEERSCQDCHMPEGKHVFLGPHNLEFLKGSVRVERIKTGFVLESVEVAHKLPSGDLYRHLTLEVFLKGEWQEIAWIGRQYGVVEVGGEPVRVLVSDSSLVPGEKRVVEWKGRGKWRLRYHYASKEDELRGLVPFEELVVELDHGE